MLSELDERAPHETSQALSSLSPIPPSDPLPATTSTTLRCDDMAPAVNPTSALSPEVHSALLRDEAANNDHAANNNHAANNDHAAKVDVNPHHDKRDNEEDQVEHLGGTRHDDCAWANEVERVRSGAAKQRLHYMVQGVPEHMPPGARVSELLEQRSHTLARNPGQYKRMKNVFADPEDHQEVGRSMSLDELSRKMSGNVNIMVRARVAAAEKRNVWSGSSASFGLNNPNLTPEQRESLLQAKLQELKKHRQRTGSASPTQCAANLLEPGRSASVPARASFGQATQVQEEKEHTAESERSFLRWDTKVKALRGSPRVAADVHPRARRLTGHSRAGGLAKLEAKAGRHALAPLVALLQLPGDERDAPAAAACARTIRHFQQVPPAVVVQLLQIGKYLTPSKYSKIYSYNDRPDHVYVVLYGKVLPHVLVRRDGGGAGDARRHLRRTMTPLLLQNMPEGGMTSAHRQWQELVPEDARASLCPFLGRARHAPAASQAASPVPPRTAADSKIDIMKLAQAAMAQVVQEGGGDEAAGETSLEKTCELCQGACFGEVAALSSAPQQATLLAGDDCELLALPRQRYADLLGSHPDVAVPDAVYRQLKVPVPQRSDFKTKASVDRKTSVPLFLSRLRGLFKGVAPETLAVVAKTAVLHEYPPGHVLVQEGAPAFHLLYLLSGSVSLHCKDKQLGPEERAGKERWGQAKKAAEVMVAGEFMDLESPYTMEPELVPPLTVDNLLGRPLGAQTEVEAEFGECLQVGFSGTSVGHKELSSGLRHAHTVITRAPCQVIALTHTAFRHIILGTTGTENMGKEPMDLLRESLLRPPNRRKRENAEELSSFVRSLQFFRNMKTSNIVKVLMHARYRRCSQFEVVFQQGDPADLFYVLLEGEVSVYTTTKRQLLDAMRRNLIARRAVNTLSAEEKRLGAARMEVSGHDEASARFGQQHVRLKQGMSFGELGVLQLVHETQSAGENVTPRGNRRATVIATIETEMLTLTAEEYEVLVRQQLHNHLVEKQLEMLKKVPALDRLDPNTLKLCATWHMVPKSYLKGAELINYKEDPDRFIWLRSGECKVYLPPPSERSADTIQSELQDVFKKVQYISGAAKSASFNLRAINAGPLDPVRSMELSAAQERACAPSLNAGTTFGMSHCLLKLPMYGVSVVASAYSDVYESHTHSFMEALKSSVGAKPTNHIRRFGVPCANVQIVDELCAWSAAEDKSRESERDRAMYSLQKAMYAEHQALEKREADRLKASEQAATRRKRRDSSPRKPQPKTVSKPTASSSVKNASTHRSKLVHGVTGPKDERATMDATIRSLDGQVDLPVIQCMIDDINARRRIAEIMRTTTPPMFCPKCNPRLSAWLSGQTTSNLELATACPHYPELKLTPELAFAPFKRYRSSDSQEWSPHSKTQGSPRQRMFSSSTTERRAEFDEQLVGTSPTPSLPLMRRSTAGQSNSIRLRHENGDVPVFEQDILLLPVIRQRT